MREWGGEWGDLGCRMDFILGTGRVITTELEGQFRNEDLRKPREAPRGQLSAFGFHML